MVWSPEVIIVSAGCIRPRRAATWGTPIRTPIRGLDPREG